MQPDTGDGRFGLQWIDVAWVLFSGLNLAAMLALPDWETVPFHFIWVSLTLLYGFRVWHLRPTMWALGAVVVATATAIGLDVTRNFQPIDEITEVPLMAAMFVAMMWHARRRLATTREIEKVSETNLRLLERERRFVQDASHELRTPITVALGQIELIHRTATDPMIRDDAAIAIEELMRLRGLAERLLLLASVEDPDFLRMTATEADALVLEVLRRWTPTPRRWEVGELAPVRVRVDPERIALALDSLIENAVKHTDPGDRIELSARRSGGDVVIAVSDSGPGISPEHLDRIFDRFGRADAGRSRESGGVGLGLSIVRAIAEVHGGSVAVRSHPGEGSTFELVLPARDAPAEPPGPWPRADAAATTVREPAAP
jgi:signal transduction histidine kinase